MKIIYIILGLLLGALLFVGAMLLVVFAAATIGIIEQALNEVHAREEWRQERPDDKKGKGGKNA